MSDLDQRVRDAFDEVKAPESVKNQTLACIEAARCAVEAPVSASAKASFEQPSLPRPRFRVHGVRRMAALAACLVLAAVCLSGYRLYAEPTAYVGIDVNPSLELSVNRFGLVVEAKALNEDGRAVLDSVSLENRPYASALEALTESEGFAPYMQETSFVEVSVTSGDSRQAESLRAESDAQLAALPCAGACAVVSEGDRAAAADAGMGVGRYRAVLELMERDPNVTLEACSKMSMRELRDRIEACARPDSETASGGKGEGRGSAGGGRFGQGATSGSENGMGRGQGGDPGAPL
ncbi:hypothetical protein [Paraeggerthella hongkongensis]|uniref:Anti-sigma factor RsgI-like middle domain-containing protein n=1 Tax=Paraeggerthella hongkongensis TaxID=230658 RepID=A0A3N0B1J0_9ACTN|nr:hypothetical protein [Paraeggerthella hongkongensis]RNL40750.1 hypothetical protein DMP08_09815 [Paraeggerthella hongkongensis]